jgi:hypothetical protein
VIIEGNIFANNMLSAVRKATESKERAEVELMP